jgi:hypothetical protein
MIPHILWKPKVHYTFRQSPLLFPILSRLNPVHVIPRYSFQTHFMKSVYAKVATFFHVFIPKPLSYFLSFEHVPHTLPISFIWLLLSTILCIRQFRDSCVYFGGACGWKFIRSSVICDLEMCPLRHTPILATWTHPIATLWIKKLYIIKEFQRSPTCNFTVWSYFLRKVRHIAVWARPRIIMNSLPSFYTKKITFMHSTCTPRVCHALPHVSELTATELP